MDKAYEEVCKAINIVGNICEQLEALHGRSPVLDEARCLLARIQRANDNSADPVLLACYLAGLLTRLMEWDQQRVALIQDIYGQKTTPLDIN